jgi:putative flippase GtrA
VVGTIGFVVDTTVLYAGLALGLGLYGGRAVSYLVAATTTWALNRLWTFRGRGDGPVHQQWALFLLVNLIGFAMNYGTYAALIEFVPMVAAHPVLGVAAGAIAGMFGNFVLSRQLVFRARG